MTPKLFKAEFNTKAEEFKKFLPVNVTTSFRSLAPSIASCESKYLIPVLGESLFNKIYDYYHAESTDNEVFDTLISMCQLALIRLAFWSDFDILSVSLSDKGASDNTGDGRLYRYQREAIKENLKNQGFDCLDDILKFCENSVEKLPEFKESEYFLNAALSFIKTTKDFNDIYFINNSRLVFIRMKYFITSVEELKLPHHLGEKFCKELLESDVKETKFSRIIPYIKRYIVFMAIAEGIAELHQLPTERGLIFHTQMANRDSEVQVSPVSQKELERIRKEYSQKAERYMNSVIDYLKKHPSDYPTYFEFAGDNAPPSKIIRRDNTNKKIFFTQ